MRPVIYEGDEAYIFVSYSHKDAEAVYSVLDELQARGYRFWYDAGIAPGSEWPEDIAHHLDAAEMVLAFITPNSMASGNCRREINFSLSRGKPFLSIYLQKTEEMSLGMQMQLSAQQSIKRFNYQTWQEFIDRLLKCPGISKCRNEQAIEAEHKPCEKLDLDLNPQPSLSTKHTSNPEKNVRLTNTSTGQDSAIPSSTIGSTTPTTSAHPSSRTTADNPDSEHKNTYTPATTPHNASEDQNDVAHDDRAMSPPAKKKPALKSKKSGLLAAVVVVIALAVFAFGITWLMNFTPTITTSWGEDIEADTTYIHATGKTITQSDVEKIASLKSLRTIDCTNCDFSDCDFSNVSFSSPDLKAIDLSGSIGVTNFEFLSNLALYKLNLEGLGDFDDLSILDTTNLNSLNISGTNVIDFDAIKSAPLQALSFRRTNISDLSPVANIASLEVIDGSYSKIMSIEALVGLEKLQAIDFSGCKISNPNSPMAALSLSKAYLADTGLTDISLLANCTILNTLDISHNSGLTSLDNLNSKNYSTLENLNVAQTSLESDDLSFVSQCSNLKELILDGCPLSNLECCRNLNSLISLSAVNCGLEDISGLAGSSKLESVFLGCNNIEDVSVFSNLEKTKNRSFTDGEIVLELTSNNIKSVENLPPGEYSAIMLYGNDESVGLSLPKDLTFKQLVIPWCKGLKDSTVANQAYISTAYLVDCPPDEVLETKDLLNNEELISKEELLDLYANNSFHQKLNFDRKYFLSVVNL